MARYKNHGAASKKRMKTCDDGSCGVCKSWRNLARAHRNEFLKSRKPIPISKYTIGTKDHYSEEYKGDKFKTIVRTSALRTCIGLTCGHLIMFGKKTHDFWLINPITKHQLRFPSFPSYQGTDPTRLRGILVFSGLKRKWVFVITLRLSSKIYFSFAGERPEWKQLETSNHLCIFDLHYFKDKIYTLISGNVYEMKLNPIPCLERLKIKDFSLANVSAPEFVSSSRHLYVMGWVIPGKYTAGEIDLNQMQWVIPRKLLQRYILFVSNPKGSAAIKPSTWKDKPKNPMLLEFGPSVLPYSFDHNPQIPMMFVANMWWYFPHDCFKSNYLNDA